MDNKFDYDENFRIEGSLDNDKVSVSGDGSKTSNGNQKAAADKPLWWQPDEAVEKNIEEEMKRTSTEIGNGASMNNP